MMDRKVKTLLGLIGASSILTTGLLFSRDSLCAQEKSLTAKRPITIADIIETGSVQTHTEGSDTKPHPAWFSPDGRKFIVSVTIGSVKQNRNNTSLFLFRTADILHGIRPTLLITMSSSTDRQGIRQMRWINNDNVAFVGGKADEASQIYTLDVRTRRLERVTDQNDNITDFDITPDGREAIYQVRDLPWPWGKRYPPNSAPPNVVNITPAFKLGALLKGQYVPFSQDAQLFVRAKNQRPRPLKMILDPEVGRNLLLAPDGKHAVLVQELWGRELETTWSSYQFGEENDYLQSFFLEPSRDAVTPFLQYRLLDTRTGSIRPLLDNLFFLHGSAPFAVWTPDGKSILVRDQFLPLTGVDHSDLRARLKNRYDVEVNVESGEYHEISKEDFPKQGTENHPIDVTLDEDVNTPPKLRALDVRTNQRVTLLDPNPQFSSLQFGLAETIKWQAMDGCEVRGGLYLPPSYKVGDKYPLVIQTHGYRPEWFTMDGREFNSGFAARALAAKKIIVLQTYSFANDTDGEAKCTAAAEKLGANPTQAWERFESLVYESAVNSLNQKGMIDPDKVGIMGFSRTVCYAAYALTHSRQRFAAAILVDGIDCGYFQYIAYGPDPDKEQLNGGEPPFGHGLAAWTQDAPGFNLNKVSAPIRLEAHGGLDAGGVMQQWEWLIGLSRLGKPVEYILLPEAAHMAAQPRERMISQGGAVDWFSFWLEGEEDPDPTKAEQYKRWRGLRRLQEVQTTAPQQTSP